MKTGPMCSLSDKMQLPPHPNTNTITKHIAIKIENTPETETHILEQFVLE
jgi:hypothetical protein